MNTKLFVGNVPYQTTQQELYMMFGEYSSQLQVNLIQDQETGQSRGFAFVTLPAQNSRKAIQRLNGKCVGGRRLSVTEAKPKSQRSSPDRFLGLAFLNNQLNLPITSSPRRDRQFATRQLARKF